MITAPSIKYITKFYNSSLYRVYVMLQDTKILNGLYTSTHMNFQRRWSKVVTSTISGPRREFYITEAPFTEPRRQEQGRQEGGLRSRLSNLWYGSTTREEESWQSVPPPPTPPPIITEERVFIPEAKQDDDIFVKNVQVCQRQKATLKSFHARNRTRISRMAVRAFCH